MRPTKIRWTGLNGGYDIHLLRGETSERLDEYLDVYVDEYPWSFPADSLPAGIQVKFGPEKLAGPPYPGIDHIDSGTGEVKVASATPPMPVLRNFLLAAVIDRAPRTSRCGPRSEFTSITRSPASGLRRRPSRFVKG